MSGAENIGADKLKTRTGIRAYRRGETSVIDVFHQFEEGRMSLMTRRGGESRRVCGPSVTRCDNGLLHTPPTPATKSQS